MDGRRPRRRPMVFGQALITSIGPTIADPDFAVPNVGTGSSAYQYNPAGAPWTYTALSPGPPPAGSGVAGNGSPFTAGNANSPAGTQVAFIQGTGTISQNVVFPAGTFTLSVMSSVRENAGNANDCNVEIDGTSYLHITESRFTYRLWTTSAFTVTAGTHTISFVGLNSAGGDSTMFLSMVSIQ